jgi:HSP20 family protein
MAEKQTDVMTSRQESQSQQQGQSRQESQGSQGSQQSQGSQRNMERQQGEGRQEQRMTRQGSMLASPFTLLQRLANEMTGVFDEFGIGHAALSPRAGRSPARSQAQSTTAPAVPLWAPDVDVFQRGNELVIRADLPGVDADNIVVEVGDDAITISGAREQEQEEERDGIYRFERSYGAFFRMIPLPEGAIVDQAKANFKDGVLEIVVPAPPEQVSRGRRIEISKSSEGSSNQQGSQGSQQGSQGSQQSSQGQNRR